MKKIEFSKSVNINEVERVIKKEYEYLNNGFEFEGVIEFMKKNGSGVYELMFGCRGGMEDIIKNDMIKSEEECFNDLVMSYYSSENSLDESIELLMEESDFDNVEELKESVMEYYGKIEEMFEGEDDYVMGFGFFEEDVSVFINVSV